ncbi:MAG: aminotransferase class I/II-fold pyridoxal phosphate-dependent enzyme [Clostridioides sp.]|nr:aminotransferase class I/II-fold pyridoxal phosphate-dependent enzyme [Clostridioides sp.]
MINHGANLHDLSRKYGFSKEDFMDFSSNINPFGASQTAKDYIVNNIDMISMYPDPDYVNLKNSISKYCHCHPSNIILGSGATELISSYIKTIAPKRAFLLSPAYSEYEKELDSVGADVKKYFSSSLNDFKIDIDDLIEKINEMRYDIIAICNPNNPTGFTFNRYEIEKILKSTSTPVMIDETYIEFTDRDKYSSSQLVDEYKNLFVIRGTSKFFSTPGLRLGYGLISNEDISSKMQSDMDLWNVNIIASTMGEIMFKDTPYIVNNIEKISSEREHLLSELSKIDSITAFDTQSNFILCRIDENLMSAGDLRLKLIPHKIIIRDCSTFEGLSEQYFRVCILKEEENRLLIETIQKVLDEHR